MFCHKCGKETIDDAVFCVYCGAKIVLPESTKSLDNSATVPVFVPTTQEAPQLKFATEKEENKHEKIEVTKDYITEKVKKTGASKVCSKRESEKAKEKTKADAKIKSIISINANDKRFAERNLVVYVNGVGYYLNELNKASFKFELDTKVTAFLDSSKNGERIKSEELIIPCGKIVTAEISLTEDDVLVANIISEEDYVGSETDKKTKIKNLIAITTVGVIVFLVVVIPLIAILTCLHILPDEATAKSIAKKQILSEAKQIYGSNVEIEKITYDSIFTDVFTNVDDYDFYEDLLRPYIDANGKRYDTYLDYLESCNINAFTSKKRAYVLSGNCELLNNGESIKEDFRIVLVHHFPKNSWWTTKCELGNTHDSSDNGSSSENDINYLSEIEAQNKAKGCMIGYCATSKINGSQISFVSCTFATTERYDSGYKFYGKLTVTDAYGTLYVANYCATITNLSNDLDVNSFFKQ